MASPSAILQRSNTPLLRQNALDGVPLCFMLRAFQSVESPSYFDQFENLPSDIGRRTVENSEKRRVG
jgi:hypothetical protein